MSDRTLHSPLLAVDWMSVVHSVSQITASTSDLERYEHVRHLMTFLLNNGPLFSFNTKYRVILLKDSKPYWRTKVFEEYKGNRTKDHGPEFGQIVDLANNIGQAFGFQSFEFPGYEADDWAGELYRMRQLHKVERDIVLWTVDSDWMQLVSDKTKIIWANVGPWKPPLRGDIETCQWVLRRMNIGITDPKEIAAIKCMYGDSVDNLPANAPYELFDLTEPCPEQYRAPHSNELLLELLNMQPNQNKGNMKQSQDMIIRRGWRLQ